MTSGDEYSHDAWSTRWSRPRSGSEEQAFVEAVSGALYVPHAAPEIRMIAEVMAAMSIPESYYVAEPTSIADARTRRRRRLSGKAFAAVAAAALGLGMAATAYAGELPTPIQDVAHSVLHAPKPHSGNGKGPSHDTPRGPDVTGPAGVVHPTGGANASQQKPNPAPSDGASTDAPIPSGTPASVAGTSGGSGNGNNTHDPNPNRSGNNGKGKGGGSTPPAQPTSPPASTTQSPPKKSPAPTP